MKCDTRILGDFGRVQDASAMDNPPCSDIRMLGADVGAVRSVCSCKPCRDRKDRQ